VAQDATEDKFQSSFSALNRALELLGKEGVTSDMFSRCVIDSRDGRRMIANIAKGKDPKPVYDSLYINSLMRDVIFASKNDGIPSFASQFLSDKGIRRLMTTLSSIEVSVIECVYRLLPGRQIELTADLAVRQGIPHTRVLQIEQQAIDKMRRQYAILTATPPEIAPEVAATPLSEKELSKRVFHALARNQVHTVGELVTKREDELLGYANFGGQKSLDEVKEFLYYKGLRLAG
jgi:hypothetical protein